MTDISDNKENVTGNECDATDEWVEHINEQASDGGGCLETALAAAQGRTDAHAHTRRNVLAAAITAIAGVGALPASAGADEDTDNDEIKIDPEDITVETPQGVESTRAKDRVLTNSDVKSIRSAFVKKGWTVSDDRTVKTEVEPENTDTEEWWTTTIKFDTGGNDEEAFVVYEDDGEGGDISVSGSYTEHVDLSGDGEKDHLQMTSYTVEDGSVVSDTRRIEESDIETAEDDDVGILDTVGGAGCGTWAFRCVASGGACGACSSTCAGAPTGIGLVSCISCIKVVCQGVAGTSCAIAIGLCLD